MLTFIAGLLVGSVTAGIIFGGNKFNLNKINDKRQRAKEERIAKVLDLLKKQNRITNNDVESLLAISDRTASRYLDELEDQGFIRKHGRTRATYYTKL